MTTTYGRRNSAVTRADQPEFPECTRAAKHKPVAVLPARQRGAIVPYGLDEGVQFPPETASTRSRTEVAGRSSSCAFGCKMF